LLGIRNKAGPDSFCSIPGWIIFGAVDSEPNPGFYHHAVCEFEGKKKPSFLGSGKTIRLMERRVLDQIKLRRNRDTGVHGF
jgi:hypothetical protein